MNRTHLYAALVGAGLATVGFLFFAPAPATETVEVIRTVVQERVVTKTVVVQTKAQTKIVYRERVITPDGTITERESERTDTKEETHAHKTETAKSNSSTSEDRKVTVAQDQWRVGVGAYGSLTFSPNLAMGMSYGLEVDRRIIGPIWLGVRASSSFTGTNPLTVGAAIGVTF